VFAYSTAHLMLGQAPELETPPPRKKLGPGRQGLGPLYGLKHDLLDVGSFYVRCAVRRAGDAGPELLAAGSTAGCAVLFPTDEGLVWEALRRQGSGESRPSQREEKRGRARGRGSSLPAVQWAPGGEDGRVPIVRYGVPLVRGHNSEVTTVGWSSGGELVTSSDDHSVRRWREGGGGMGTHLRTCGEFGGQRHLAGWADVGDDWDEEDDEC